MINYVALANRSDETVDTKKTKLSRTVTITNEFGLHARPAAKISQLAGKARSGVKIRHGGMTVDAKCVIDILTLACARDSVITLLVESTEDIPVLNAIFELIENRFEE
jgi:phosphocarrier protein HPr